MTIRTAIVAEACAWTRTPFHHGARVRGAGVDCANLLIAVYSAVGLMPAIDTGYYPPDWHLHRDEPRFLAELERYADKLPAGEAPLPGDIAMFRYGRHAAHGAVIVSWPMIVHAWLDVGCVDITDADNGPLSGRLAGFWRMRGLS